MNEKITHSAPLPDDEITLAVRVFTSTLGGFWCYFPEKAVALRVGGDLHTPGMEVERIVGNPAETRGDVSGRARLADLLPPARAALFEALL